MECEFCPISIIQQGTVSVQVFFSVPFVSGIYTEKCEAIAAAISKRQEELDAIVRAGSPQGEWIAHFKSFRHVDVMERKILVKIIDRIYVYEGNRIEIIFKYQNEYRAAAAYIEQYMERQATQAASTVKEAV